MSEQENVLFNSNEAAVYETRELTGWWARKGEFCGENEKLARTLGSTHSHCEKHNCDFKRNSLGCPECRNEGEIEAWKKLPVVEIDITGDQESRFTTPLCLYDGDEYFWSGAELLEFCRTSDCNTDDLMLRVAEPVEMESITAEYFLESMGEDAWLPDGILQAIENLNKAVEAAGPLEYLPGGKRVRIKM